MKNILSKLIVACLLILYLLSFNFNHVDKSEAMLLAGEDNIVIIGVKNITNNM